MVKSKQQKLAEAEARAARLRLSIRADDTRQKIVTGGAVILLALRSPPAARMLLSAFELSPPREHDLKVVGGLIDELHAVAAKPE